MKRNLFVAIMTVASVFVAKAQNNDLPIATLQHGDQTLVFTGVDSFTDAYAAAADKGDILTEYKTKNEENGLNNITIGNVYLIEYVLLTFIIRMLI